MVKIIKSKIRCFLTFMFFSLFFQLNSKVASSMRSYNALTDRSRTVSSSAPESGLICDPFLGQQINSYTPQSCSNGAIPIGQFPNVSLFKSKSTPVCVLRTHNELKIFFFVFLGSFKIHMPRQRSTGNLQNHRQIHPGSSLPKGVCLQQLSSGDAGHIAFSSKSNAMPSRERHVIEHRL